MASVQAETPEIAALVASPRRQLAFRTFAYIRVGVVLGELLVESDTHVADPSGWVTEILTDPANRARVVEEVRAVAREVAADLELAEAAERGAGAAARERFRRFARESGGA